MAVVVPHSCGIVDVVAVFQTLKEIQKNEKPYYFYGFTPRHYGYGNYLACRHDDRLYHCKRRQRNHYIG